MISLKYVLIEGTGNTFALIDSTQAIIVPTLSQQFVFTLCTKHGVDGLLHIVSDPLSRFRMHYYNRDGLEASMCGNGLRCCIYYLGQETKSEISIATQRGPRTGTSTQTSAKVEMGKIDVLNTFNLTDDHGNSFEFYFVDSGVPHALTFVTDIAQIDLSTFGPYFRNHEAFGPDGTNVSAVQRIDNQTIAIRTYERFVEAETGACGTASCAACTLLQPTVATRYTVIPPSQIPLFVDIIPSYKEYKATYRAILEGPCSIYGRFSDELPPCLYKQPIAF